MTPIEISVALYIKICVRMVVTLTNTVLVHMGKLQVGIWAAR